MRQLESELRSQEEVERERDEAISEAAQAVNAKHEAEEDLRFLEKAIDSQADEIRLLKEEVDRLGKVERAAKADIATRDILREALS